MATPTDQLKELKKIAEMRFDRERHKLAAMNEEAAQIESEQRAVRKQIVDLTESKENSPSSLMNAYAYLDALAKKSERLIAERREASLRTEAQREKIKTALASKIRVDGMGED